MLCVLLIVVLKVLQANLTQNITSNIPASISINTKHPHPLLLVDCMFDYVNCLHYI